MKCQRIFIFYAIALVGLTHGRGWAQSGEVVELTEAGITEAFNGVDLLSELNIAEIAETGPGQAEAMLTAAYSFEAPGVTVTISDGAVTFSDREPADASLVLARREADLLMSLDLSVEINDRELLATLSLWKWYGIAKYEGGSGNQRQSKTYVAIRLQEEVSVADFGDLLEEFDTEIPMLGVVGETAMRNPEIIIPIGLFPIPIVYATFEAAIGGESKDVDIYAFSMSKKGTLSDRKQKVTSLALMLDFHSIPIKLEELAGMVEDEVDGASGFSAPFANDAVPRNGRVKDAAVVVAIKRIALEIRDLDPVMRVPFYRIYGEGKQLSLHFVRGVNMVATFTPEDFPDFYQYFEKLNFARDLLLTVQGSLGWEAATESDDDDQSTAQEYLKMGLYVGLSTWDIPQYLEEKGYSVVEGAGFEFFVEHVPSALQLGVGTHFNVNAGGSEPIELAGSLQAVLTTADVGMALAGKMTGVWRSPANIPFGIKDPVIKVKVTADNTYFVGAKGSYYIGNEGEEKKILVGGERGYSVYGI